LKDHKKADDQSQKSDDKLASLLSYHKAKGLHFKCGDKWVKGHTCPAQVPLHIVEEMVLAATQPEAALTDHNDDFDSDEGLELLAVMKGQAQSHSKARKPTMRLVGWVGKQQTLILVDLGSAATFVSTPFVEKCGLPIVQDGHTQYTTNYGGLMILDKMVPKFQWFCQGYTYYRDTKVMQLPMYDIILGADWLEDQGSVWIDWKNKVMKFQLGDKEIILIGVRDNTIDCPAISNKGVKRNDISHWIEVFLLPQQCYADTTTNSRSIEPIQGDFFLNHNHCHLEE
jgi:hypothetical protein